MLNVDWTGLSRQALWTMKKHGATILTGIGIGGMLTTTVLAVSETPEAMRRIEEKKRLENHRKLTTMQKRSPMITIQISYSVSKKTD